AIVAVCASCGKADGHDRPCRASLVWRHSLCRGMTMMRIPALLLGAGFACVLQAQTPTTAPAPAPAASCSQAEAHQFDFWIGEWDVVKPDGTAAGSSRIEAILGGCVIQENWTSATPPYAGKSFNLFNQGSGHWEQFWVDNGGARLHLVGGMVADSMVMSGVQD